MKTEYQKCMDGEPFDGSSPELVELTLQTKRLLRQLRETDYADDEAKKAIYRLLFGSIGNQVSIDIDFRCEDCSGCENLHGDSFCGLFGTYACPLQSEGVDLRHHCLSGHY